MYTWPHGLESILSESKSSSFRIIYFQNHTKVNPQNVDSNSTLENLLSLRVLSTGRLREVITCQCRLLPPGERT